MDVFQLYCVSTAGWATVQLIPQYLSAYMSTSTPISPPTTASSTLLVPTALTLLILTLSILLYISASPSTAPTPPLARLHTAPARTALLWTSTLIHLALALLHYTSSASGTGTAGQWLGARAFVDGALASLGGGLLLFGSGAGSDRKGRSHLLFETPEHKEVVRERHRGEGKLL